jgi:hypothetical protein
MTGFARLLVEDAHLLGVAGLWVLAFDNGGPLSTWDVAVADGLALTVGELEELLAPAPATSS